MLQVVDVRSRNQVKAFIRLPHQVHQTGESRWVAPPDVFVRNLMGPLDDSQRRFLLALDDGQTVGRIGVKVHHDALHFGFFECLHGRADAAVALVEQAHALAPSLPMRGPYHFTLEDPYTGLLVQGHDLPPHFLMPYNPPYYADLLGQAGLVPVKALHAYEIAADGARLEVMRTRAARARELGFSVRYMNWLRARAEVRAIADIFEDALGDNWGFEPFNATTLADLEMLARFVPEKWGVMIAHRGGMDVGCLIVIPNFNMLLGDLRGRLHPSLVWRYLRRGRIIDTYRGMALGVLQAHQGDDVTALLVDTLMEQGKRLAWRAIEFGWVLEDNTRMIALARALGARRTKVYQVLERAPR